MDNILVLRLANELRQDPQIGKSPLGVRETHDPMHAVKKEEAVSGQLALVGRALSQVDAATFENSVSKSD